MNKYKGKTIFENLAIFLKNAYSVLNHDPNCVFNKNQKGDEFFIWEDELFQIEICFVGVEHIIESHIVRFKFAPGDLRPIWSLLLQGNVFDTNKFSIIREFRKSVNHMHKYNGETIPIKGPKSVTTGVYKYTHTPVPQDWKNFKGCVETVLANEKMVFQSSYQGGLMVSSESLEKMWSEYGSRDKREYQLPDDHDHLFRGYTFEPFIFVWPG